MVRLRVGGEPLAVEGTRSSVGRRLPFKKGGFVPSLQTGGPIVAVAIMGGRRFCRRALRIRPGDIDAVFDAPWPLRPETRDAPMATVRERISNIFRSRRRPVY